MRKVLNLNPKSIEESNKDKESTVLVLVYFAAVFILCLNILAVALDNKSLKDQSKQLKSQINNLKSEAGDYTKIENEIKSKEEFIGKVESLENTKDYKKYICDIGKYMPSNIYITSGTYNDALITLNGVAKNEGEIAEFLANLQMSKDYSNAELVNINKVEEYTETPEVNLYVGDVNGKYEEDKEKSNKANSEQINKAQEDLNNKLKKSSNNLIKGTLKESAKSIKMQFTINIKE